MDKLCAVSLSPDEKAVVILDQTLLPGEVRYNGISDAAALHRAISRLEVRGAPAIGVAAALGLYVCSRAIPARDGADFRAQALKIKDYIASSRPTAVNLFWALDRAASAMPAAGTPSDMLAALRAEALAIWREDEEVCAAIGRYGAALLSDGFGVMTHCNAGSLATAGMGTALAPVYTSHAAGTALRVYCGETRPLLQGARLTALELTLAGVDATLMCDNMAASLMSRGLINAVFVGCDRVAANGDAANKIGTLGAAVLARHFGVPFYICAPFSTIDFSCPDGSRIPIEERAPDEVTELWYRERMAPRGVKVYNPAFDVTPAGLVTAFVTERGIFRPEEIASLGRGRVK